ncbi:MAG: 2-hydroxypropyl-CoM dehydrogenase [Ponticaulis sp.]|nr:2-hydroxypropyl-CoM dehydrogenase [Ponticaulis sp.]
MNDFSGKVVVITGAGSGMGRSMVAEFVSRGAKVAALGRTLSKLNDSVDIAGGRSSCLAIEMNVSDEPHVVQVINRVIEVWGQIDILINNAGILDTYAPAHEVSLAEWEEVISTNLTGPFLMSKYAIPHMLKAGQGAIINIASISSISAAGGGSAYTASKHGVQGLMKQLCFEYGQQGIRVNEICPGATATPMAMPQTKSAHSPDMEAAVAAVPARRWCDPSEIAKLAAFLASDDASYIHGSSYVIDGGWLTAARDAF